MATPSGLRPPFPERRFHAWLRRGVRSSRQFPLPLGDDAAAVRTSGRSVGLLTTDALVEGTHFLPKSRPREVGAAAAAVSLSDVASKGGRPIALLLDLLLPPDENLRWARSVVRGARAEMERYGGQLVGGDTKPSAVRAVVGTIFAETDPRWLPTRDGARPGDVLISTGTVGRGGAAAARLEGRGPTPAVLRSLLRITPRLFEGRVLARFAHAMIDTSDGLAEASRLVSEASRVRLELDLNTLPYDRAVRKLPAGAGREALAFYGGDYELLVAVAPRRVATALREVEKVGGFATVVGAVRRGRGAWGRRGGSVEPLPAAGWDPFRSALSRRGTTE